MGQFRPKPLDKMKTLVWNCRGLGGSLTVPFLKETMRLHSPSMVFLSETKNREGMVLRTQRQLHMTHTITVDPVGLAGGLCLFWNDDIQMLVYIRRRRWQALVWRLWIAMETCFKPLVTQFNMLGKPSLLKQLRFVWHWKMLRKKGWTKVQILSDAKMVVDMILRRTIVSWEIETTCEDIWNLMRFFEEVNVVHIPRTWNIVAHNLAKFSISLLHNAVWFSTFPRWIDFRLRKIAIRISARRS